jgi:hypothetical protein
MTPLGDDRSATDKKKASRDRMPVRTKEDEIETAKTSI